MGDGTSGREKVEGQSERAVMLAVMVTKEGLVIITQMGDIPWNGDENADPHPWRANRDTGTLEQMECVSFPFYG
jgi:hypothetical protein